MSIRKSVAPGERLAHTIPTRLAESEAASVLREALGSDEEAYIAGIHEWKRLAGKKPPQIVTLTSDPAP